MSFGISWLKHEPDASVGVRILTSLLKETQFLRYVWNIFTSHQTKIANRYQPFEAFTKARN